jgi:hypothetical protein
MFLHLLGIVGTQSVLRVMTQQSRDEVPRALPHLIRELEPIIQGFPVHLRGILYIVLVS